MRVHEIPIAGWDHLLEEHKRLRGTEWIFRGQGSSAWDLETSIERLAKSLEVPFGELPYRERGILRRFKRQYHHYSSACPDQDDNIEWLSIMRHYGAPTRLLDW